jgi:DNA-binding NarL/FixJ family response regulator
MAMRPPAPLSPQHASLVGRTGELQQLRDCWHAALHGRGNLVLIGGEAGIGKTTLTNAFVPVARQDGATVLSARCFDTSTPTPYGLWLPILSRYQRTSELQRHALVVDPAFTPGADPEPTPPGSYVDAVMHLVSDLTAKGPLVLVLEDLHWADQTSLNLLRHLGRQLDVLPMLVVCTYRDVELTAAYPLYRLLPHLVRETPTTRIPLRRLSTDAVRTLLHQRYGLPEDERERLTEWLEHLAEGSPFFLTELLHALEVEGLLQPGTPVCELADLHHVQIPQLVQQVADGYLARLDQHTHELLQIASIIGEDVPLDLWQAVANEPDDSFMAAVEACAEAGVLIEIAGEPALRFRHAIIREALYRRLVLIRRRSWHRRVAEALVKQRTPDVDAIAHHFLQADDLRAADWLVRSGRQAADVFALGTSATRFEQALALLREDDSRLLDRAFLLCELAETYRYTATDRALQALDEADDLARTLGDRTLQVLAHVCRVRVRYYAGEPVLTEINAAVAELEQLPAEDRARLLTSPLRHACSAAMRALAIAHCGAYEAATLLANAILAEDATLTRREQAEAHFALGLAHAAAGRPREARGAFASARQHYRAAGILPLVGASIDWELDLVVQVYESEDPARRQQLILEGARAWRQSVFVGLVPEQHYPSILETLLLDGRWNEARATALALREVGVQKLGCARILADLDWLQGYPARAWAYVHEALPDGPASRPERMFFPYLLNILRIAADLALDAGDAERARPWIAAYEDWHRAREYVAGRSVSHRLWTRYFDLIAEPHLAREHAELSLTTALEPRQPFAIAFAERRLAELDMREGALREAAARLDTALQIVDSCGAPFARALVQLTVADLHIARGQHEQASAIIEDARSTARQLESAALLKRIDILASQITLPRTSIPGGLSPRELDVLRLVAQGLTDAEVAERLYISPRTVSGHLQSVYTKLGLSSRTAAAAFAFEHNLI